jgi:outer membrane protein OmpU
MKMKKYLLGTSALVAAGLVAGQANAADKFTMGVGGFMEQFFGFMDNEDAPGRDWGHFNNGSNDTEIHFKGTLTMDNGIKIAARVEIESNEDAQNVSVDEVWLQLSSDSLGLLVIGSDDMPADGMSGYPKVGIGLTDVDNWVRDLNISGGTDSESASTLGDSADVAKLVYYTPVDWQKEWGIQLSGGIAGNLTNANTEGDFVQNSTSGFAYNVMASYSRRFGDIDTYVAAAYYRQVDEATTASYNGGGDLHGYQLGLNLKWGPWEVGGGYQRTFDDLDKKTLAEFQDGLGSSVTVDSVEGWSMNAGIAYTMGAWQFGFAYGYGEIEGAVATFENNGAFTAVSPGKDRRNTYELASKYDFGNGLNWRTSLVYAKYHNGDVVTGATISNSSALTRDLAENDDGWALVTGFTLTF